MESQSTRADGDWIPTKPRGRLFAVCAFISAVFLPLAWFAVSGMVEQGTIIWPIFCVAVALSLAPILLCLRAWQLSLSGIRLDEKAGTITIRLPGGCWVRSTDVPRKQVVACAILASDYEVPRVRGGPGLIGAAGSLVGILAPNDVRMGYSIALRRADTQPDIVITPIVSNDAEFTQTCAREIAARLGCPLEIPITALDYFEPEIGNGRT